MMCARLRPQVDGPLKPVLWSLIVPNHQVCEFEICTQKPKLKIFPPSEEGRPVSLYFPGTGPFGTGHFSFFSTGFMVF